MPEDYNWSIYDFQWGSEIHIVAHDDETSEADSIERTVEMKLLSNEWATEPRYELTLRFYGVEEILIRNCPGPIDPENIQLIDMDYTIEKLGCKRCNTMERLVYEERRRERCSHERYRFGDTWEHDEMTLRLYAKQYELVGIRPLEPDG